MPVTIPEHDVKASNLIFVGILLAAITVVLYPSLINPDALVRATIVSGAIRAGLAFGIRAGYGWVRMLFLLYMVPFIGLYLMNVSISSVPIGKVTLELLSIALQVWAAVIIVKDQFFHHD